MVLMEVKREDAGKEKHLPVVEVSDGKTVVRISSIPHPMESGHYIEWIEAISGNNVCRRVLKPGDEPKVEFEGEFERVRAYCNVHGLWER